MKIVILYDSKSGNTEQMAKAVAEGGNAVKGVEVELLRVGTRFSMTKLNEADALVLGSPAEYGSVTQEMRSFIELMFELTAAKKLKLKGKIGNVFGSYGWDGGWVSDKLTETMRKLGISVVGSAVSAVDHMGSMETRIDQDSLQKCRELGGILAEKLVKKR